VNGDDAELIAWEACRESNLDDRPRCDPLVMAACYLQLRLCPVPRAEPRIVGDRLIYPGDAEPTAIAYFVGHEVGHELALDAGVPPHSEERLASRIGVAVLLPRVRYRRDLHQVGWDLDALGEMWPLASPWVHARRIAEITVDGAVASRWSRSGQCRDRIATDGASIPPNVTALERALARAALSGERVEAGARMRAWPTDDGAIVVCGADDLHMRLARATPIPQAMAGRR
jgi:hypothetical protein